MAKFTIVDNLGNVAEATDAAAAATAAAQFFEDSPNATSVVFTRVQSNEEFLEELKQITKEVGEKYL
jgi:hypothetical protein